jgi:hypothetical protein
MGAPGFCHVFVFFSLFYIVLRSANYDDDNNNNHNDNKDNDKT